VHSPIPHGQLNHTLTYVLVDAEGILIIDPGWDSAENLAALQASLAAIGARIEDVVRVVATHHHPDHLGLAAQVRELSGAEFVMGRAEAAVLEHQLDPATRDRVDYQATLEVWGVPPDQRENLLANFDRPSWLDAVTPDRTVEAGELLVHGSHELLVVATPGHTGGHICLVDRERGIIYTGDHVLPQIHPGVGIGVLPGTEPLGDYLESLVALEPYDDLLVLPGHEYTFHGLAQRREELVRHHLRRTREAAALLGGFPEATVWALAQRMTWTGGWESLQGFILHSALRQVEMHLDLVRSGRAEALLALYS
jgi:glyoxylase-like metal-dependent hydrolase (beta-lactamase superfamily II)